MVQVRTTIEPDKVYEVSPREAAEMQNRGYLLEEVDVVDPSTVTNVDAKEEHDRVQTERREELEKDHSPQSRAKRQAKD